MKNIPEGVPPQKIVVAVTGASGAIYARLLLQRLSEWMGEEKEVAVVFSRNGRSVWNYELGNEPLPGTFKEYAPDDFFAPFASGSSLYDTMIICPCTMGTLGRIAHGVSDGLITRGADVMLKERRRLIMVVRDMPYSLIHVRNMCAVTEAGAIVCPASPSFYSLPDSLESLAATVVDRVLRLAGVPVDSFRWGE